MVEQIYVKMISREVCMELDCKFWLLYMQYFLRYWQMKIANFARAHTKSDKFFSVHVLKKVDKYHEKYLHKKIILKMPFSKRGVQNAVYLTD